MEEETVREKLKKGLEERGAEVNIDDKLYLNRWKPDEESHLEIIDPSVCAEKCPEKNCTLFCPARVYQWRDGRMTVGYEGCLECGACRIACPHGNIRWRYPKGGHGVQFRLA